MKVKLLFFNLFFIGAAIAGLAQKPETEIKNVLMMQAKAWNKADIAGFMKGYWQNDSLLFVGQSGVTYGWQNTLNNYKKNYSDSAKMGQLQFDILQIKPLSPTQYFVVGKWLLQRSVGNVGGHFTLIFRRFATGWKIVVDHSS